MVDRDQPSPYPFIAARLSKAAEACGTSETTLREAMEAGDLVANYLGKRATVPVVRAAELDAWVKSRPTTRGGR